MTDTGRRPEMFEPRLTGISLVDPIEHFFSSIYIVLKGEFGRDKMINYA